MENLFREQQRLIESVSQTKRYIYDRIDWNERCIGILGARGTGKTTLMLQYVRERYGTSDRASTSPLIVRSSRPMTYSSSLASSISLAEKCCWLMRSTSIPTGLGM